jgi:hypothetical protein
MTEGSAKFEATMCFIKGQQRIAFLCGETSDHGAGAAVIRKRRKIIRSKEKLKRKKYETQNSQCGAGAFRGAIIHILKPSRRGFGGDVENGFGKF